jgi:hypothetical protein
MPQHPGINHRDNGICLIGAGGELLVVCFSLDYQSFRVAPKGDWSRETVVQEVSYLLGAGTWKARFHPNPPLFTHTPLSPAGTPHDDQWWEYQTWDGGYWKCKSSDPHGFYHVHLDDSKVPLLEVPPDAKCQFVTYGA